jgi:hypothetical protein
MSARTPVTIVETPQFLAATRKMFDEEERAELVNYLADNPTAGDLIEGTGGVRKLRWAMEGRGKRGGARVIYFFHNVSMPLFLITAYAKNVRADLSQAERNDFRQMTKALIAGYRKNER